MKKGNTGNVGIYYQVLARFRTYCKSHALNMTAVISGIIEKWLEGKE